MITLYDFEMSGDCYQVRLLLSILKVPHRLHPIDFYPGREHQGTAFLKLNPLGELPVLKDEEFVLHDSHAILVYLASRYDAQGSWYPREQPERLGAITSWLLFAERLGRAVSTARLHDAMFYEGEVEPCRVRAHALFRILDRQLWFAEREGGGWVCGSDQPTIADLACFPHVMLSEEADIARRDYPALRRWGDRVRGLPEFIPMSGVPALPAAQNR